MKTLTLTTDHASSSYGVPVLVDLDGNGYGPSDIIPGVGDGLDWLKETAAQVVLDARRHRAERSEIDLSRVTEEQVSIFCGLR